MMGSLVDVVKQNNKTAQKMLKTAGILRRCLRFVFFFRLRPGVGGIAGMCLTKSPKKRLHCEPAKTIVRGTDVMFL